MKEHLFKELVNLMEKLEKESGRIVMRKRLAAFLKDCSTEEIDAIVYLILGKVAPDYKEVILGVSNALCLRALAIVSGYSLQAVKEKHNYVGDVGELAATLLKRRETKPVTVRWVYEQIVRLAQDTKIEYKLEVMADTLLHLQPLEAKYYFRILLEQLRVGIQEPTILEALTLAKMGSLDELPNVRRAYHLCGDVGKIAKILYQNGMKAIKEIKITCGLPIVMMLAKPLKSADELIDKTEGEVFLEYKFDGLRVQAHICDDHHVELYSRNLGRYTEQFPDLITYLLDSVTVFPCIIEGEIVAYDYDTDEILPFQVLVRRRGRKHDIEEISKEIPVSLFVFDILLQGTEELLDKPYTYRRKILENTIKQTSHIQIVESHVARSTSEIEIIFQRAIQEGTEGLIGKHPSSVYIPGKRGIGWFKLKRDYQSQLADTVDCVVIGAYHGTGKRAGTYGSLLCAIKDDHGKLKTVCKVGSGLTDDLLEKLPQMFRDYFLETPPKNVEFATELEPDVWIEPRVVVEIEAAEITLSPIHTAAFGKIHPNVGLALRFPRFKRFREDKSPQNVTTESELIDMYRQQPQQKITVSLAEVLAQKMNKRRITRRKKATEKTDSRQKTLDQFLN